MVIKYDKKNSEFTKRKPFFQIVKLFFWNVSKFGLSNSQCEVKKKLWLQTLTVLNDGIFLQTNVNINKK